MFRKTVLVVVLGLSALARVNAQDSKGYWGLEASAGGVLGAGPIPEAAQDRYTVSGSGNFFDVGLARMHGSGSPNFSFRFTRMAINGDVTEKGFPLSYNGSASLPGFLFTKYLSVISRKRVSAGFGAGIGIGPQLKAKYHGTSQYANPAEKTWTLDDLSVSPLFQVVARADFRVSERFSIGPFGGIQNGLPIFGGMIRVHFVR
jgi:hypothetical protein